MFNTILVGIDPTHTEEGPDIIHTAASQLADGGELHVMSVLDPVDVHLFPSVPVSDDHSAEDETLHQLDLLIRKHLPVGLEATSSIARDKPGPALCAEARRIGADLIALNAHDHRWPLRRDTVHYVAVNAPCAVLLLPPTAEPA